MNEREDALLLIRLKAVLPESCRHHNCCNEKSRKVLPRNTGGKNHAKPDTSDNDRRAKVRLEKDKDEKRKRIRSRNEDVLDRGYFDMPACGGILGDWKEEKHPHVPPFF